MATTDTSTLRVPTELRDEIAELARQGGTTMVDVVTRAIAQLRRDEWWDRVHQAVEDMPAEAVAGHSGETDGLDGAAADGLAS